MDIRQQLETLKQQLEQEFETETPERKVARERALQKLETVIKEFSLLSRKIGTTSDQMAAIAQLQQIIFKLGDIKGPEK